MTLFKWDNSLSVKVDLFDEHHRKLVKIINDLYDAMMCGNGDDSIGKVLDELTRFTEMHFQAEENYFDELGYPDSAAHKNSHDSFIQILNNFKLEFKTTGELRSEKVLEFLKAWLIKHIKGTDKKYVSFFNSKGIN